jgi:hypothetical protein
VLGCDDDRVGCVEDLAAFDALGRDISEVLAARHTTGRLVIDDLVGIGPHGEVLARGTGLLASVAIHLVSPLRLRLSPTIGPSLGGFGLMLGRVRRRWERRVLRALVQPPGKLGDHAGQAFDLAGLRCGPLPQ